MLKKPKELEILEGFGNDNMEKRESLPKQQQEEVAEVPPTQKHRRSPSGDIKAIEDGECPRSLFKKQHRQKFYQVNRKSDCY
ncbi:hypothetical protein ATZ36_01130 [Candidatus Endomicrobiellum trichonymphae]|uniref:Uncharacterized protein n=1 Tax=Endomicrobium trichonymphae TaxID=1408204 RepID=A0A1E5IKF8_ENDTX|nr:hypothetical protein ATZ36_01130 [Candidatus Endomicrobium trichonymphae]